jgi:hypothetical protein
MVSLTLLEAQLKGTLPMGMKFLNNFPKFNF